VSRTQDMSFWKSQGVSHNSNWVPSCTACHDEEIQVRKSDEAASLIQKLRWLTRLPENDRRYCNETTHQYR
jgi:hypothetical protein